MQHEIHNVIELQRVEAELRNHALRHHYLVVDDRVRNRQPGWLSNLSASFRALLTLRPVMREERGV